MIRILHERQKAGVEIRIIGKVAGSKELKELNVQKLQGQFPTRTVLHTRTIVRDRHQAFIGSQSLRKAELDSRRELGLIVNNAFVVKRLCDIFEADWVPKAIPLPEPSGKLNEAAAVVLDLVERKNDDESIVKAGQALVKELDPLAATVKQAVRKAVERAGDAVIRDKSLRSTVKKVAKKVVKQAVKDAVEEVKAS
jgi:hypothetical protein